MSNIESCQFYCLSYNNKEKRNSMKKRFDSLNIKCRFYTGVDPNNDDRFKGYKLNKIQLRQWSCTYGHLDIINDFFYNSDKPFAIICEDDICIHKDIKTLLHFIISDFNLLRLDILLLSYLLPYRIGSSHISNGFSYKTTIPEDSSFSYHNFPNYISGTQMYIITRNYASKLLDKYYDDYAGIRDNAFLSDKVLFGTQNRALLYPMLAVENENQEDLYHKLCHNIHFIDGVHL